MKRNFIKLVDNVKEVNEKGAEPQFKTYLTPSFIPLRKIIEATTVLAEVEENGEGKMIEQMLQTVADIYNNQFEVSDILDKLHAPDAMLEIRKQIEWASQGVMDDERKKELAKMI